MNSGVTLLINSKTSIFLFADVQTLSLATRALAFFLSYFFIAAAQSSASFSNRQKKAQNSDSKCGTSSESYSIRIGRSVTIENKILMTGAGRRVIHINVSLKKSKSFLQFKR